MTRVFIRIYLQLAFVARLSLAMMQFGLPITYPCLLIIQIKSTFTNAVYLYLQILKDMTCVYKLL